MDTKALEKFCPWARIKLIDAVRLRCMVFGLDEAGIQAHPAGSDIVAGTVLTAEQKAQRDRAIERIQQEGYSEFLQQEAYGWFNRFAAIRYMELHDFLPCHIRMLSNTANEFDPDCLRAVAELDIEGLDCAAAIDLAIAGNNEELFRMILMAQMGELAQSLPSVFANALELTLPSNLLGRGEHDVLFHLVTDIPAEVWESVEVLGWMYQFYNSELKDNFFKSKRKAAVEDLAPATQLFTPDWIVRYMVENSLGRLWMLNNPGSRLRERMAYYIEPDEGHEDFIHVGGPEDITFCDPACGSGHILVYAFDLLFDMYLERGYREREIPTLMLQKNLSGMEIDERAAQIASLALALCARAHDRRFFTRGVEADIRVLENIAIDTDALDPTSALRERPQLLEALEHLGEVGSLLVPEPEDVGALKAELMRGLSGDLFVSHTQDAIARAAETCEALARTFDVVVANPPYMGSSSFNPFMSKWMKKHYPDSCKDLCTAFIERGYTLASEHGYAAMVTMQSWMFLGSFEKMRNSLIDTKSIVTMAHLGPRAFDAIGGEVVSVTADIIYNGRSSGKGAYFRLVDVIGSDPKRQKLVEAIQNPDCGWFYRADAATFHDIPGSPIAYWASKGLLNAFKLGISLENYARPRQGLATGDNNKFLREWWEVHNSSPVTWVPCTKGGGFRRWYGDAEWVVNWSNNGSTLMNFPGSVIRNPDWYFKEGSSWGMISSSKLSMRYMSNQYVFTNAGLASIGSSHSENLRVLALMNSSVAACSLQILAPTLNYSNGDLGRMPVLLPADSSPIEQLSESCIQLSRADWDTQETSWDFKRNALV